jgi:hypothetical protein
MSDAIFMAADGTFVPTGHARGPWDPAALHGGAPAALITRAFERMEPASGLDIGRLCFDFLRPIPLAPLTVQTRVVRAGRRVQELAAEMHSDGELICRATALRVQRLPAQLPVAESDGAQPETALEGPAAGRHTKLTLDRSTQDSFGSSAMDMRWLSEPGALGPGRVWMRLQLPLLDEERASALSALVATADFGNGISATLPFESFVFINADLTIHLEREPEGEWIGLDARTTLHEAGVGLSESVLHDERGAVGRAFQSLVVWPR